MDGISVRYVDSERLQDELRRMQRLDEAMGITRLDAYFTRIKEDGWLNRNPQIFHLVERREKLIAFCGLLPLTEISYRQFLSGERFPFSDIRPDDILTPPEHARARIEGLWLWLESFSYADAEAARSLSEYAFGHMIQANVQGILVATSRPEDEEHCRWWGFVERYERGTCPSGKRKLWYAEEASVVSGSDHPFGRSVPGRGLFIEVRRRFGAPAVLGLSPAQRRVARLFYLEEQTEREVARALGIRPETVKTYLKRIREKAEPHVGSTLSRAVSVWLREHLAELAGPGG